MGKFADVFKAVKRYYQNLSSHLRPGKKNLTFILIPRKGFLGVHKIAGKGLAEGREDSGEHLIAFLLYLTEINFCLYLYEKIARNSKFRDMFHV
jgi:hypothetical protein